MEQLVAALAIIGLLAGGTWLQYRLSKGRMWDPLWLAFSTTFASVLFLVTGGIGYRLERRLFDSGRWVDGVIWWQVELGLVFAALALLSWRRAIAETDRRLAANERRRAVQ